jgi:hypothetical protein
VILGSVALLVLSVSLLVIEAWPSFLQAGGLGAYLLPLRDKSPAGSGVVAACGKLLARFLLLFLGRYFVELMGSVRVLMQTLEHLFAAMVSRSSSVTFRCATDVALGFYHKEVNERSALPVPFFRVDRRWISNWHTERKSSRTQQSEI